MVNAHIVEDSLGLDAPPEQKIADLEEKIALQANKFSDISTIGTVIATIMDLDRILPLVIESTLSIVSAEVGHMVIYDDNGGTVSSISWGISKEITDSIRNNDGVAISDYIYESKEMIEIDNLVADLHWSMDSESAHITSLIALPLSAQNLVLGAIFVANKIGKPSFDEDDLFSLQMIARFAAVAIENSNLHARAVAQQKIEAELEMAKQTQKALMPDNYIEFDQLRIRAYNIMAMQVGGDFYDVVRISDDKFLLVVADVSSKGFPASLLMSSARSLIRAYAMKTDSPAEVMANVNEQLCNDSGGLKGMFVTLIMVYFDFKKGILKAVNAGHPPGWIGMPDGTIQELKQGGPFIGQFDDLKYTEQTLPVSPNSKIFLYTDGAFECVDKNGKMLGLDGLRKFYKNNHHLPGETFINKMTEMLSKYSVDPDWIDDTTYLLAEIKHA
ncbi:MAG: GAF domain-containing SpoIIE family protein phosphatase [candidate division Zixibacteria bacterium]